MHIAHFPMYYMEFFNNKTGKENPKKQQEEKEATHSWIVTSELWSQVKDASENCTALSVEKKSPL